MRGQGIEIQSPTTQALFLLFSRNGLTIEFRDNPRKKLIKKGILPMSLIGQNISEGSSPIEIFLSAAFDNCSLGLLLECIHEAESEGTHEWAYGWFSIPRKNPERLFVIRLHLLYEKRRFLFPGRRRWPFRGTLLCFAICLPSKHSRQSSRESADFFE